MKILVLLMILSLTGIDSLIAQEKNTTTYILPGPEHSIVLLQSILAAGEGQKPAFPKAGERFDVFRSDGNKADFKKVGSSAFPASASELGKKLGEGRVMEVLNQLHAKTINEAYQILLRSQPDTLGMMLLSPELLEVFGMVYIDRSRDPAVTSVYRVVQVSAAGADLRSATAEVDGSLPVFPERYSVKNYQVSDSSISINWYNPTAQGHRGLPLFAQIYRQEAVGAPFQHLQKLMIMNSETSDSSSVYVSDQVNPGSRFAYFMQLEDLAGNKGAASDTLYALAVDITKISGIRNLQVTDTTQGLWLSWQPLPRQAIYSAIQILKSRQPGADYVAVDTIAATESTYLDEKVLPASSYYYKVRPLIYNLPNSEPLKFAEANGHKSAPENAPKPAAPQDLRAELSPRGVQLSWQHGDELNLFGYYVLRGTSATNLEVVSLPIQDTVFIDSTFSPGFSGQLHYALQVMNLSQVISDTSAITSVTLRQPVILSPPGGIQSRRTVDGIALQWEQTRDKDDQVEGYVLYRRQVGEEAYQQLNKDGLLRLPFYTDSSAVGSANYEYAVTSADSWGNQSILSPVTVVGADTQSELAPPLQLHVRNLIAGIEVAWPEVLTGKGKLYAVYRRQAGETAFIKLGSTEPGQPFLDKTVKPDVLYEYTVAVSEHETEGARSLPAAIRRLTQY